MAKRLEARFLECGKSLQSDLAWVGQTPETDSAVCFVVGSAPLFETGLSTCRTCRLV